MLSSSWSHRQGSCCSGLSVLSRCKLAQLLLLTIQLQLQQQWLQQLLLPVLPHQQLSPLSLPLLQLSLSKSV